MIPLYIIEEHNEAFYIWNRAVSEGRLPPFGNTLLHVDHHPDFECGVYSVGLDALFAPLEDMLEFTRKGLGIADFICPAIYQGLYNEIVFIRDFNAVLPKPEDKLLTLDAAGCLTIEVPSPLIRLALAKPDADHCFFTYRQGGLGDFHTPQPLALDIDLDYFCWDDSLSSIPDKRIEITGQAYRDVTENPYHPFRLFPKVMIEAVEVDGRYYMSYRGLPNQLPLPDKKLREKRVDVFVRWLARNKISPCMISICRSRFSGYTPQSVWEEIENCLLGRMKEVYEYDIQS